MEKSHKNVLDAEETRLNNMGNAAIETYANSIARKSVRGVKGAGIGLLAGTPFAPRDGYGAPFIKKQSGADAAAELRKVLRKTKEDKNQDALVAAVKEAAGSAKT